MENGLSNEDLRKIEEKERDSTIKFRASTKIRIVSGGRMEDFEELRDAAKFMFDRLRSYPHASIHVKCPIIVKEDLWPQITSLVQ